MGLGVLGMAGITVSGGLSALIPVEQLLQCPHGASFGSGTWPCLGQHPTDPCTSQTSGMVTQHQQFSEKDASNNINFLLKQTVR